LTVDAGERWREGLTVATKKRVDWKAAATKAQRELKLVRKYLEESRYENARLMNRLSTATNDVVRYEAEFAALRERIEKLSERVAARGKVKR
jgi:chromosome segregation ATPase